MGGDDAESSQPSPGHPVSPSSGWYLRQAGLLYGRADECLRLAGELDGSPLPTLLSHAGDETWRCPAADEFRRDVLLWQRRILEAIETLRANAYALGCEADELSRTAAAVAAQERASQAG